ncbi:MAG: NlpC/P60 family protein [Flavobacteriia bacterium]|jgi:hypothetical protein
MKFAFCKVAISPIRKENADPSEMVSQMLFGEVVEIIEIKDNWTNVRTFCDNYEGWTDTKHLLPLTTKELNRWLDGIGILGDLIAEIETPWGNQIITKGAFVPDNENDTFNIGNNQFKFISHFNKTKHELKSFALSYLNAPYLWGGKSPLGIDCSGFTQTVYRYIQKNIPRDAYQQADFGLEIPFSESELGDLAFFTNSKGKITHVGIILEDQKIIHASGWVRIDELKADGIYKSDSSEKTHDLFVIKRI